VRSAGYISIDRVISNWKLYNKCIRRKL